MIRVNLKRIQLSYYGGFVKHSRLLISNLIAVDNILNCIQGTFMTDNIVYCSYKIEIVEDIADNLKHYQIINKGCLI